MGALEPASDWLGFYLLSYATRPSASCIVGVIPGSVGREPVGAFGWYQFLRLMQFPVGAFGWNWSPVAPLWDRLSLPGETELGSAEEQPNKG